MPTQDEMYRDLFITTYELTVREKILVHIALLNLRDSVAKGESALQVTTTEISDLGLRFAR
jgi:hypothetical protein